MPPAVPDNARKLPGGRECPVRGSDRLERFLHRKAASENAGAVHRGKMLFEAWSKEREARSLTVKTWDEMFVDERECWIALGRKFGLTVRELSC